MKKRVLSLALAMVLAVTLVIPAMAADNVLWVDKSIAPYNNGGGIPPFTHGFSLVTADNLLCLIDTKGNLYFKDSGYDFLSLLSEKLVQVQKGGKSGLVDLTNQSLVLPMCDGLWVDVARGTALVQEGTAYKLVDLSNNVLLTLPAEYDRVNYSDGLIYVRKENLMGVLSLAGEVIFPVKIEMDSFDTGVYLPAANIAAAERDGKWGMVDASGAAVIPFEYDHLRDIGEDFTMVVKEEKLYIITPSGKLLPDAYDRITGTFRNGTFRVVKGGVNGYLSTAGVFTPLDDYEAFGGFYDGLAMVSKPDEQGEYQYGFIDETGALAIPCQYDKIVNTLFMDGVGFHEGYARVEKGGQSAIINVRGEEMVPFGVYDDFSEAYNGVLWVAKGSPVEGNAQYGILTLPAAPVPPATPTVLPSPCAATLDGKPVTLNAYLFTEGSGGANYVMLRDVAYLLNGTKAQFEVTWDKNKGIILTTGQAYTPLGGEMQSKGNDAKPYAANTGAITIDGKTVELTAYTIEGNNYFKLRDLGAALGFTVGWDGAAGTVLINTSN